MSSATALVTPEHYAGYGYRLVENGYPVVPIIPHAKVPGYFSAGVWSRLRGWSQFCAKLPADYHLKPWSSWGPGWGVPCGTFVSGVDIDVRHSAAAIEIEDMVRDELGDAPTRIGQAPKRLLVYRPDAAFKKVQTAEFTMPGDEPDGKPHRVEILGDGQQFVAFGIHPTTGREYEWLADYGTPLDVPQDELGEITERHARAICERAEAILEAHGGVRKRGLMVNAGAGAAVGDLAGDLDEVSTALRYVPNDDLDYDSWIKIGYAIDGAVGPDSGAVLFHEWSSKSNKYDPDYTDTTWKTLRSKSVGAGTIFAAASSNGWERCPMLPNIVEISEAIRLSSERKRAANANGPKVVNPAPVRIAPPPMAPTIRIVPGELHQMASQAENALVRGGAPFYARGQVIVKPIKDEVPASKGRVTTSAKLVQVRRDGIIDWLSRLSRWEKYDARKEDGKNWVPADPPAKVAMTIESRYGEWRFPKVAGVVTTPTLRRDGTVLDRPGYDPDTRLILVEDASVSLGGMPANPTRDDAVAALGMLRALVVEFPFVADADRSVGLSALITPVVRGALATAPLHAIRAPTPGSGKSFLVDVASFISSGKPCPVLAAGKTEEETEKRLGGAFLEGMPLISVDNVNGELAGDQLCQLIDRPLVKVRPLGVSDLVEIESRATVFATGNNLRISGDLTRRAVLCELDAGLERPELKNYAARPDEAVLADRGRYVGAALTVTRAYLAAGMPGCLPDLASFEDWSRLVRSALVWLGEADPCASMERIREEDPERAAATAVVEQLLAAFGDLQAFTAREAADCACEQGGFGWKRPDMRDALLSVAGHGGVINTKSLGRWLVQRVNRPFDGTKIVKAAESKNGTKFRLVRL